MPDDQHRRVAQSGRVEQRRPVEPGRFHEYSSRFHETAECTSSDSTRVACTFAIAVSSANTRAARACRVRETRQLEHRLDVRLVLLPQLNHLRSWREIVVAIGHSKTALEEIGKAVGSDPSRPCGPRLRKDSRFRNSCCSEDRRPHGAARPSCGPARDDPRSLRWRRVAVSVARFL